MNCPVCSTKNAGVVERPYKGIVKAKGATTASSKIFLNLRMKTCKTCSSSWVINAPTQRELGQYYKETYKPAAFKEIEAGGWPIYDTRPVAALCASMMFTDFKERDLFLDMGPGNGASFSAAQYIFKNPKLACIEYNAKAISIFKKKVPGIIIGNTILDIAKKAGKTIKLFYSGHCFEHLTIEDIHETMTLLRKCIDPDGVLYIEIPLCPEAKLCSIPQHVPHLTFFSEMGFSNILETNGFDVVMSGTFAGRTKGDTARRKKLKPLPRRRKNKAVARSDFIFSQQMMLARAGDWVRTSDTIHGVLKFIAKPKHL
jgi:hypothetical protein